MFTLSMAKDSSVESSFTLAVTSTVKKLQLGGRHVTKQVTRILLSTKYWLCIFPQMCALPGVSW